MGFGFEPRAANWVSFPQLVSHFGLVSRYGAYSIFLPGLAHVSSSNQTMTEVLLVLSFLVLVPTLDRHVAATVLLFSRSTDNPRHSWFAEIGLWVWVEMTTIWAAICLHLGLSRNLYFADPTITFLDCPFNIYMNHKHKHEVDSLSMSLHLHAVTVS